MDGYRLVDTERRRWMAAAIRALGSSALVLGSRRVGAADAYPATIAAVQLARDREMTVYHRYREFGQKAKLEGYRGIAYLFTALAASELIHAQNFDKILARLGVEVAPAAKPQVALGTTRENLIQAAGGELDDINRFYPETLARLKPELYEDATVTTNYAWESEKQHRAILRDIQRWSGSHFEQVARSIDEKTGQYFLCQICGSVQNEIPKGACPICRFPSAHYRKIELPS